MNYPPDMPPVHLNIMETESTKDLQQIITGITKGNRNFIPLERKGSYKLPLPTPMTDETGVNYDANFGWLNVLEQTGVGKFLSGIGYTPNQQKTVVLAQPEFKQHSFEWKFAPRNKNESIIIQKILHSMRRAMTPPLGVKGLVFGYPRIFVISFSPSPQFLYKFKPCVLRNMQVDYMGGQPIPAFYSDGMDKPEALKVRLTFLEIEYWIRENLNSAGDGLPSTSPYDHFTFYTVGGAEPPTSPEEPIAI